MNDKLYQMLNKNLNNLLSSIYKNTRHYHKHNRDQRHVPPNFKFHITVQNLTNVPLSREKMDILQLGFQNNFEKPKRSCLRDLATVTAVSRSTYRIPFNT